MTSLNLFKKQLDNGLQVLLKESHVAPVASFWIYYQVGSRNELPGRTGISHWVEHMLFKGTQQFPAGEFDKAVSRAGGVFNGMTSQDLTTYFETLPSDRIDLALQVESDRMVNAVFDPKEVDAERGVIISEREGSENSYFWLLNEEVQAAAFREHPYRHPIIGWKNDLHIIDRDALYEHYRTYYTPRNALAVAVGDFDTKQMFEKIEQSFGQLPSGPNVPEMKLVEPEQGAERRISLRGGDPIGNLMMTFQVPRALHEEFFPLIVLDAVLSGAKGMGLFGGSANNRSNRLYKALVESQLALGAGSFYRPAIDTTLFTFQATITPGVSHEQVEEVIWHEITDIQEKGVTSAELTKAIKQTKAQFAYSSESVTYQAYWLGFSEIVATTEWLSNWLERLSAVTVDDVRQVAHRYFTHDRQTVGWYVPKEGS